MLWPGPVRMAKPVEIPNGRRGFFLLYATTLVLILAQISSTFDLGLFGKRMANSSPPTRATTSLSRNDFRMTCEATVRRSSPLS
jgi:hypothetical protein